jgi:hypothetical protein
VVNNRFSLGLLSGFLVAVAMAITLPDAPPDPYSNVSVISTERVRDNVEVLASFRKNECTFIRLETFGSRTGVLVYTNWNDLQGHGKEHDRIAGEHTLAISIRAPQGQFDSLEIRTRHDCNGVIVDKVFAIVPLGGL